MERFYHKVYRRREPCPLPCSSLLASSLAAEKKMDPTKQVETNQRWIAYANNKTVKNLTGVSDRQIQILWSFPHLSTASDPFSNRGYL
jgi:hypothetical protein